MIKANELKIGNLIKYYNDICKIESIDNTMAWILAVGNIDGYNNTGLDCSIENIDPIPLTEDWLIKFGFELKGESRYGHKFIMPIADWGFIIENSFEKETWFFGHEYYDSGDDNWDFTSLTFCYNLKYVHQLQNIYFALTGEELTYKND